MKKKKGLILIPFLTGFGGTETVIKNLLSEYNKEKNKHNIELKLYSLGGYINGDWLHFSNVKVFQFPKSRYFRELLYSFMLPFLIFYSIFKEKPNFIISTNPIIWTIAKLCSYLLLYKNMKVIAWYHYSYKLKPVKKYFLNKPDYFFTISKSGKNELINLGINSNHISVIYNPVKPTKQVIKPSKHHNKFIYIGRLEYKGQKNISELFKALSYIKQKSWDLKIYGTGPDKFRLQKLSRLLHISKHIKWMGFMIDPLDHIKNADALILTSTYEGFSMVLAEAISRGLYVISSNCPVGPSELIKHNISGNLYKIGDICQLSNLINNVLCHKNIYDQKLMKNSLSKYYLNNYLNNFFRAINVIYCK